MRADVASGTVAVLSGLTAVLAAALSLQRIGQMPGMPPMAAMDPLPAALLLGLGLVVLVNGTLLLLGVRIPMRPQGGAMVVYGLLMALVGVLMLTLDLFRMDLAFLSALLMLLFGGVMMGLGFWMASMPAQTGLQAAP